MKTKIGHYYVFFSVEELTEKINYFLLKGLDWLVDQKATQDDMPCVLNVDSKYLMIGIIESNKEKYFQDPTFVKLYNKQLRKYKLKRILKIK